MSFVNSYQLSHSGIKGMRWGIRRYQNADGTLTEEGKIRYGNERNLRDRVPQSLLNRISTKARLRRENKHKKAVENAHAVRTDVTSFSDEELRKAINRMKLEKEYSQLMDELHPERLSRAQKFASKFLDKVLENVTNNAANALTTKSPKKSETEKFGESLKYRKIGDIKNYSFNESKILANYIENINKIEGYQNRHKKDDKKNNKKDQQK